MTLDEAVTKATRELDRALTEFQDRQMLKMIEAGVDPDMASQMIADQRAQLDAWRPTVIAQLREMLLAQRD